MTATKLTLQSVIESCGRMVKAGAALHWLRPGKKNPMEDNWSSAPVPDLDDLRAKHRENANIGIRLGEPSKTESGYLHLIDLDIRKPEQAEVAWGALREIWPECDTFPSVISGSGGESRHIYFLSDKPFRKTRLAKSEGFEMVPNPETGKSTRKNNWEIDLYGTGAQAVLPPSIHPDTGLPYRWERPLHADMLVAGFGPTVASDRVENWGAKGSSAADEDDEDGDDLLADMRQEPLGLEDDEIHRILADLPNEWVEERELWVTAGAALHHEFGGSDDGFRIWCEWSKQSEKFEKKHSWAVWKSFSDRSKTPVRMATLKHAAASNRLSESLPQAVETTTYPDLDVLLGDSSDPSRELAPPKRDPDWARCLQITEEGAIKGVLHNVKLLVANDPRTYGIIAFNQFTNEIVRVREPGMMTLPKPGPKPIVQLNSNLWRVDDPVNGNVYHDSHDNDLRGALEAPRRQGGYDLKISDRDLGAAVDGVANQNAFHPVRFYLESVEWDGIRRIDKLFVDYLGCEDTQYHREAASLTMLGAVARIYEPGHKFDFVPILEGLQGKRKSTFIRVLGRKWFSELIGDFSNNQQMIEQIQGSWIMEIPELQGFSKADTNQLKAWVTRSSDKGRLAYERRAKTFPRQCVFIGSTNDDTYLRDATGGRRFWPIKCGLDDREIDTDGLDRVIDLMWAEAVAIYKEMRKNCQLPELPLYLTSDEARIEAKALQESRKVDSVEDSHAGKIGLWLDRPIGTEDGFVDLDSDAPQKYRNVTCVAEIWTEMEGKSIGAMTHAEAIRFGRALGQVEGWRKYSGNAVKTKQHGRQRLFVREGVDAHLELDQY